MKQPYRQEHEGKVMEQRLLYILKRAGRPLNHRGWVAVLLAINALALPLSAQNILQRLDHDLTAFYHRGDIDTAFVMRPLLPSMQKHAVFFCRVPQKRINPERSSDPKEDYQKI